MAEPQLRVRQRRARGRTATVTCQSGDVVGRLPAAGRRPRRASTASADLWGEPLNGNFGQLLKLKAKHPKLKVLMSLGGWTWSKYFSDAALTPQSAGRLRRVLRGPCSSRATCPRWAPATPAGPARRPASSTASTSTGSGRAARQRRQHHPPRGQGELHRCWSPSSASSSTRTARDHEQALRAERVPAGRPGEDRRRLRRASGSALRAGSTRPSCAGSSGCGSVTRSPRTRATSTG